MPTVSTWRSAVPSQLKAKRLITNSSSLPQFPKKMKIIRSVEKWSTKESKPLNLFSVRHFFLLTPGSVSNTASYLRLWALSLAHNQLAKVFMEMILLPAISSQSGPVLNTIKMSIAFVVFAMVTFAVILVMDMMECFLHALRWVFF